MSTNRPVDDSNEAIAGVTVQTLAVMGPRER